MNSKILDRVLQASRALVNDYLADRYVRSNQHTGLERLAAALAQHDQHAREAMRAVGAWVTLAGKPREPFEAPPSREGSLKYLPTPEQYQRDPLLSACHAAGMSETQVIELQRLQREKMMEQLMRLAEIEVRLDAACRASRQA